MAKITKGMCRDFLRKVENKALGSIDTKYRNLKNEALMKDIEGYPVIKNLLLEAGAKVIEAKNLLEDLHKEIIKEDLYKDVSKKTKKSVYSALEYNTDLIRYTRYISMNNVSLKNLVSDLSRTLKFKNYEKVCKEYEEERKEVARNYSLVREELNNAKSGKQCHKILTDLGFDTSSIEKEAETSNIIKEVDKSKLFVCGATK